MFYSADLLVSGLLKVIDRHSFKSTLASLGIPSAMRGPVAAAVIGAELLVGASNLRGTAISRRGAMATIGLFSLVAIAAALSDKKTKCRCFGSLSDEELGWNTVARNAVLLLPGIAVEFVRIPPISTWYERKPTPKSQVCREWKRNALYALVVANLVYCVHIARTQQRILARVSSGLHASPTGQTTSILGTQIPSILLNDLKGAKIGLDTIRPRKYAYGLVFLDPVGCVKCTEIMKPIRELIQASAGSATIVVVSTKGSHLETAEFANGMAIESGLAVLYQDEYEAFEAMKVDKVPSAVLVSSDGQVVSEFARGREEVLNLLRIEFASAQRKDPVEQFS